MAVTPAILVQNLTKTYKVFQKRQLLSTQAFKLFKSGRSETLLNAVDDVTFSVNPGEILGIIGHNGSGKSTLLKVLSGITQATKGSCEIIGRVTSLLELGVGFEPELTGRENLYLYGTIIGLPREIIEEREERIISFSGIEDFIDLPVKTYSSGMLVRLAFSTAIHTDPDVLLLDEVLGVGDDEFRHRSFQAIQKAVEKGVTVVIVSHGLTFVGSFCSRVMCLENGRIIAIGAPEDVISAYMASIGNREKICDISLGATMVRVLPGGFHIENRNSNLTVAKGCSVNLHKWETFFSSTEAAFTILNHSHDSVSLQIRWGHWNLNQIWHLTIRHENEIQWIIESGDGIELNVDRVELEFMLSAGFHSFIVPEETRQFPDVVNRGFKMEYLLPQKHGRRFMGASSECDSKASVILDFSRSPASGSSMIISGGNLMPAKIFHRGFSTRVVNKRIETVIKLLNQSDLNSFVSKNIAVPEVLVRNARVCLEEEIIHVHIDKQRITRSNGFHLCWSALEHQELFNIERLESSGEFILRSYHACLPIISVIIFRVMDDSIHWRVELDILSTCQFQLPQIEIDFLEDLSFAAMFEPLPLKKQNQTYRFPNIQSSDSFQGNPCRLILSAGTIGSRKQ